VRDLGAFLYAFYSMAVWPQQNSLERSVRPRDMDGASRLLTDLDELQVLFDPSLFHSSILLYAAIRVQNLDPLNARGRRDPFVRCGRD
jgi:hypothetical protein